MCLPPLSAGLCHLWARPPEPFQKAFVMGAAGNTKRRGARTCSLPLEWGRAPARGGASPGHPHNDATLTQAELGGWQDWGGTGAPLSGPLLRKKTPRAGMTDRSWVAMLSKTEVVGYMHSSEPASEGWWVLPGWQRLRGGRPRPGFRVSRSRLSLPSTCGSRELRTTPPSPALGCHREVSLGRGRVEQPRGGVGVSTQRWSLCFQKMLHRQVLL